MNIDDPIPFDEAIQYQAVKKLLPTTLSSAQLSQLLVAIRQRALFSARCTNAVFLQRLDDLLKPILNAKVADAQGPQALKGMSESKARATLKEFQDATDYTAPEGKAGTIEDLSSDSRLNLIIRMNVGFARGFGSWKQGQTPAILDQYPCQELYRREDRKEPRDWPARWQEAGGQFYGEGGDYDAGRMIARKDDPIWEAISAFGLPYAPFDFNSGMDLMDVDRDEAIDLGVIDEGDSVDPQERDLNDDMSAGIDALDSALSGALLQSVGDAFGIKDGLLQLLNEAGVGCLMARMPAQVAMQMLEFAARIPAETLANESRFASSNFNMPLTTFSVGWDEAVKPKMDAARAKAVEAADDAERDSIQKGHGCYKGSCGHIIEMCPCGKCGGPTMQVDALCRKCSEAANERASSISSDPHVTILYGLEGVSTHELTDALAELAPDPILATLGKVTRFPGSNQGDAGADVLVIEVHSSQLEALHDALAERFADRLAAQTHSYVPHATLAYIKPGSNLDLDGYSGFDGIEVIFQTAVFSTDDVQEAITLASMLNEMVNEGKRCGDGFIAARDTCHLDEGPATKDDTESDEEKPKEASPIAKPITLKRVGDQPMVKDGKPVLDKHGNQRIGGGKWVTESGGEPPEHIKALVIPPAWRNVTVSADPDSELQAKGIDAKDRVQSIYSDAHDMRQSAAKFARVKELMEKAPAIEAQNEAALNSPDHQTRENAAAFKTVFVTGIRPGGEGDTGADKKAYGATTLEGRHVKVKNGVTRLVFNGKKGVALDIPVTDPSTAEMLRQRAEVAGPKGRLFDTSAGQLLSHSHLMDGGGFKTKDFRTHIGTKTAIEEVNKMKTPKTMQEYKDAVNKVGDTVAEKLGNTRTVALNSYIAPEVFAGWRAAL